ncbi:MAG TPA: HAMP domain-containing sensor histidine kinase [Puia sp.]|nr:HAMP domain-containing sensor histidine kinase [Puia sp.]
MIKKFINLFLRKRKIGQTDLGETVRRLKETVTRLEASEQDLLRTNAQRETLISLVIHDLRSPLRFLTYLATDLYDNQGALSPAELRERAYLIKKGAQDIYHFSDDFLLWVTSQTDKFSISRRPFPIGPLFQEIADFFSEQVQQRGNQLCFDAGADMTAYSDPHVVITILRNLVDNANKYTSRGTIRVHAARVEAGVLITVADTGRGMSPSQVSAFLGDDSLDEVRTGSQLGHRFIADLTRRLDGALSVKSAEGKGTTVSVLLPAGPAG